MSYERMGISAGQHVIDVGCGPGIDAMNLSGEAGVGPTGKVTGFDHDAAMLKEAKEKIKGTSLEERLVFVQGNAENLPFRSDFFDHCRSERLFMHLRNPERALHEITRVTKPGGRIVIIDTDWSSVSIDNPFPHIERTLTYYRIERILNNGYSGRSLYRQFRQLGLADVHVELFPIALTSLELFDFISMQRTIEIQALADGVITELDLTNWRQALNESSQNSCFFCQANMVIVSASKPLSAFNKRKSLSSDRLLIT